MSIVLPPVGLLWGEGRGEEEELARYWIMSSIASDDGTPWRMRMETNDVAPAGLGGECAFTMAYLTVRQTAGTLIRVTPIIDDQDYTTRYHPNGTVYVSPAMAIVPQRAPTSMVATTYELPLSIRHTAPGSNASRTYPRGERCRLRIESLWDFGAGAFRVEQCELEYQVMRRAKFASLVL